MNSLHFMRQHGMSRRCIWRILHTKVTRIHKQFLGLKYASPSKIYEFETLAPPSGISYLARIHTDSTANVIHLGKPRLGPSDLQVRLQHVGSGLLSTHKGTRYRQSNPMSLALVSVFAQPALISGFLPGCGTAVLLVLGHVNLEQL